MTTSHQEADDSHTTCSCRKCRQIPGHGGAQAHQLLRHLIGLLDEEDIAFCVCSLAATDLSDDSEAILCEVGQVSPIQLAAGRESLREAQNYNRRILASVPDRITECAGDRQTFDLLMNVASTLPFHPRSAPPARVSIKIGGHNCLLQLPGPDGYQALYETIVLENYKHAPVSVDSIYDLGAHIGISSVYLHTLYPRANFICVEPARPNLTYLQVNLASNFSTRFRIVPCAVAGEAGDVILGMQPEASMINSTVFSMPLHKRVAVRAVTLKELVEDGTYGIKIDVEGGEYDLALHHHIFACAKWIMGEFHYGSFSRPSHAWLRTLLTRNFDLRLQPPRIARAYGEYIVLQDFQAFAKSQRLVLPRLTDCTDTRLGQVV